MSGVSVSDVVDPAASPDAPQPQPRPKPAAERGGILRYLATSVMFAFVTIVLMGIVYPLLLTGVAEIVFPSQANGSLRVLDGRAIGSDIVGELWTQPRYFTGRPSAAGKNGYDPTATGATNLGPASKKLVDATRSAVEAQKKANPDATVPLPMDLVTSSASGIDPDISPQAAFYQAARIAKIRRLPLVAVNALIRRTITMPQLGFLGEPHVNVLRLNLALDRMRR